MASAVTGANLNSKKKKNVKLHTYIQSNTVKISKDSKNANICVFGDYLNEKIQSSTKKKPIFC